MDEINKIGEAEETRKTDNPQGGKKRAEGAGAALSEERQQMWRMVQEFHRFSRRILQKQQKRALTAGEMELLSLLCLEGELTPHSLGRMTGKKQESVSRTLRFLYEKGCIARTRSPEDARSVLIGLSEEGERMLGQDCRLLLEPMYELERQMGEDFFLLASLISKADRILENQTEGRDENENEVL